MDKTSPPDWNLLRAFLAVADSGSLSAAARSLASSQPTLGRQISTLEQQLGAELFHRRPRGLALTESGAALVGPARQMQEASRQISLAAAGQQTRLDGTVRITASVATAAHHMPAIIAEMRAAEPGIEIELVASDESRNLLYREADIAVRMYRPTQLDLITRHIGDLEIGIYAAQSYIDRCGLPQPDDWREHDFVGFDANTLLIDGFAAMGRPVTRDFFAVRCDDNIAHLALIAAGCGVGFAQVPIANRHPNLVRLDWGFEVPPLPVWLTAHEAMRQTPRIRRVWSMLEKGLAPLVA